MKKLILALSLLLVFSAASVFSGQPGVHAQPDIIIHEIYELPGSNKPFPPGRYMLAKGANGIRALRNVRWQAGIYLLYNLYGGCKNIPLQEGTYRWMCKPVYVTHLGQVDQSRLKDGYLANAYMVTVS